MRKLSQNRKEGAPVFTADDHLWVQVQIEKRAHERWRKPRHQNAKLSSSRLVKGPTRTRNKATTPDRGTVADDVRRRNPHPARPSTLRQLLRRLSAYEYHV